MKLEKIKQTFTISNLTTKNLKGLLRTYKKFVSTLRIYLIMPKTNIVGEMSCKHETKVIKNLQ